MAVVLNVICTVERNKTPDNNESTPRRMLPDATDAKLVTVLEDKGVYE